MGLSDPSSGMRDGDLEAGCCSAVADRRLWGTLEEKKLFIPQSPRLCRWLPEGGEMESMSEVLGRLLGILSGAGNRWSSALTRSDTALANSWKETSGSAGERWPGVSRIFGGDCFNPFPHNI